jgi:ElaB/YqjD/DUF883 family membrane-anchored ribosome-binding protein
MLSDNPTRDRRTRADMAAGYNLSIATARFKPHGRFHMAIDIERTRDHLVDDFATVLTEAEDMLKRASNETGDRARDLRAQVEAKLLAAKLRLQEMQGDAVDRARDAARATDDYVHDNPWQAVGAAAAVGFVVGMLMTRR